MLKCKTCGTSIPDCVESDSCPDCLQEAQMTGFQDNQDPFDLDAEIESEGSILEKYLTQLGL